MRPPGASRPARQTRTHIVSIANSYPESTAAATAVADVARCLNLDRGDWVQAHRDWWHAYYRPELCLDPRQEPGVALLADDLPVRLHQPDRALLRRYVRPLVPGRAMGLHHHQLEHPVRPLAGLRREPARAGRRNC